MARVSLFPCAPHCLSWKVFHLCLAVGDHSGKVLNASYYATDGANGSKVERALKAIQERVTEKLEAVRAKDEMKAETPNVLQRNAGRFDQV